MGKKNGGGNKKSLGKLASDGIQKLKDLIHYVVRYWSKAPEGKSLCFKEMAAYCVGGMGVSAANILPQFLTLAVGVYIAAALDFSADAIMVVGVATSVFTVLKSPIIGWIIDNTKSKFGKFRPYLIWMPIPSILCIILIGWIPNLIGEISKVGMIVSYAILFNVMQVFIGLYTLSFNSLIQVISPSPEERTGLMSVGSVVYSLGPSIVTFLLPLIAKIFDVVGEDGKLITSGLNMVGTYQWILPIMAIVFFSFGYWTAFGTKERVVVSKKFKQKVKFFDGIRQTVKNKYFWLSASSLVLGVFRLMCTSFTAVICLYLIGENAVLSVANVLLGMAYVPGMLLAPILIKKLGKRNLVLISNTLLVAISLLMMLFLKVPYVLLVCNFLAIISNSVQVVTGPAMIAQYYDFQQFKTGNRLEGFMSQFSAMITSFFAIFTVLVAPAIAKSFGYVDKESYNDNEMLRNVILLSLIIGAASAALGAVPYFFWDLNEKKHRQIMEVLAVRAKSEDDEIPEDEAKSMESRILCGETDVYKNYFAARNAELVGVVPAAEPVALDTISVGESEEQNDGSDNSEDK